MPQIAPGVTVFACVTAAPNFNGPLIHGVLGISDLDFGQLVSGVGTFLKARGA